MTKGEELIVQAIVQWHPGCGGGCAWIRWGLAAIRAYRTQLDGPVANAVGELTERLWKDPRNPGSGLLASPSTGGGQLMNCAVHYISHPRFFELAQSESRRREFERLPEQGTAWAREVANLVTALFELPPDAIDLVRRSAAERGLRIPMSIDLDMPDDLVDAVEAILSLENAIEEREWEIVSGKSLELEEARRTLAMALRIAVQPNCRSGRDIAFRAIARDFNRQAFDGHELELSRIKIIHVPEQNSPLRESVRKQMLSIVEDYFRLPISNRWPEREAGGDLDEWAAKVVQRWRSEPAPIRDARENAAAAAHILVGLGDDVTVPRISRWLDQFPDRAPNLFRDYLFETYCYEIVSPGRRRDLLLAFKIPLSKCPPPMGIARRDPIEVFRPISGTCERCGARLVALFDLLVDAAAHRGLPPARRVAIPLCPNCCEGLAGYSSSIRMANQDDNDAWPWEEAASGKYCVPSRRFHPCSASAGSDEVAGWLGGQPNWEQGPSWPKCDRCRRRMIFAGQINAVTGHPYVGFFCAECLTCNVRTQYD